MGGLELFGLFVILRWLFGGGAGGGGFIPGLSPQPTRPPPGQGGRPMPPPGDVSNVVWPSTPPATLPAFPAGWEYDEPPPAEVQRRAAELLTELWAKGPGSRRVEMVGGRWITFVAEVVRGGSRGITAYRVKSARPTTQQVPPAAPQTYAPSSPPAPAPAPPGTSPPATAPTTWPTHVVPSGPAGWTGPSAAPPTVYPVAIPPGAPAVTTVADVQSALNTLGWTPPLVVDGKAGPLTQAAVSAFQRKHPPLVVDGKAGPLTKAAIAHALATNA
jgi:hypothetical protein